MVISFFFHIFAQEIKIGENMNTKTATKTNAFLNAVGFESSTLTENGAKTLDS